MESESYSANGIKHCVRPCDMAGKSCAIILRQIHPETAKEAIKFDRTIDLPQWFSSISLNDYNDDTSQTKNNLLKYHI